MTHNSIHSFFSSPFQILNLSKLIIDFFIVLNLNLSDTADEKIRNIHSSSDLPHAIILCSIVNWERLGL
jgi:hypothetical protein